MFRLVDNNPNYVIRYIAQREERTPYKLRTTLHQPTKRSLTKDLDIQYLATHGLDPNTNGLPVTNGQSSDEGIQEMEENIAPSDDQTVSQTESVHHVSVIRRVGGPQDDLHWDVPILGCVPLNSGATQFGLPIKSTSAAQIASPIKSPRKQADQRARFESALALIQLAQGK